MLTHRATSVPVLRCGSTVGCVLLHSASERPSASIPAAAFTEFVRSPVTVWVPSHSPETCGLGSVSKPWTCYVGAGRVVTLVGCPQRSFGLRWLLMQTTPFAVHVTDKAKLSSAPQILPLIHTEEAPY